MADISSITLPGGGTYDLKDKNAQPKIITNGILKGDGQGGVSAATAGTDYAPANHASTATTYGKGDGTNYGHLKLSNSTSLNSGVVDGVAATPKAVKDTHDFAASRQAIAYVENGTAASRNYASGEYICWNGYLYTADTAISSGTTLAASGSGKNLTEEIGGGFAKLANSRIFKIIGIWSSGSITLNVPSGHGPRIYLFGSADNRNNAFLICNSDSNGTVQYTAVSQGSRISFATSTGQLIATLAASGNGVTIVEMPMTGNRYSTLA